MTSRIPPLLDPYLALPSAASLVLLTSVLGASTNWLTIRYLYSYLKAQPSDSQRDPRAENSGAGVLLVSFLRDLTFWKEGASRLGLDLDQLSRKGRFAFLDGLTGVFLSDPPHTKNDGPGNGSAVSQLTEPSLAGISRSVTAAVESLQSGGSSDVVLIIDGVDLFLAATGEDVTSGGVHDMLLGLRESTRATILTLAADEPLLAAQVTTLEREHAALVLSLAHEAEMVASLRLLDTGTARDVSGVIRITRGGADTEMERELEEREFLYHVGGDGSVKVFERGQ